MHNIEKSGFRAGEYVGYGFGKVFKITKRGGYWNAVSQEKPQMTFTAKTLREISAYLDGVKTNPAPRRSGITGTKARSAKVPVKRKTAARTQRAAEGYVNRPSQITKKAPSKRLKTRRTKNLQVPRGVFPNPSPRAKRPSILWRYNKTTGLWDGERSCIKNATCEDWLKVYSDDEPNEFFKVSVNKPRGKPTFKNPDSVHFDIDVNSHNARGSKAKTRVNPAARKKEIIVEYELSGQKYAIRNRGAYGWKELAKFPDTPEGSENAIQYAEAYHKIAPHLRIQVVTK